VTLPNRIFLTGVPGSRWSGIAQTLETIPGFNTSDRTAEREFNHGKFSGHRGVYYGTGMEYVAEPHAGYLDQAWPDTTGTRIIKSHEWAYWLDAIKTRFPDDWIMLVYRPDMASYAWWHEAGGFNIKYPNYDWYENSAGMLGEIGKQNQQILKFAHKYDAEWNYFTNQWIYKNFHHEIKLEKEYPDILVTIIR
jgi:hypothetical protein